MSLESDKKNEELIQLALETGAGKRAIQEALGGYEMFKRNLDDKNKNLVERLNESYSKIENQYEEMGDKEYIIPFGVKCLVEARDFLLKHQAWEAKMLETDECWEDSLPKLNQELYDESLDIQGNRNHLLSRIEMQLNIIIKKNEEKQNAKS